MFVDDLKIMFVDDLNIEKFKDWLSANGHQVLTPTNEWEVLRFKNGNGTGIIYQSKSGLLNFQSQSGIAFKHFREGQPWPAPEKTGRRKMSVTMRALVERDGPCCFYCDAELGASEMTREHVLSVAHGGNNHIANLVIACQPCNLEASHLSVAQKVALREEKRTSRIRSYISTILDVFDDTTELSGSLRETARGFGEREAYLLRESAEHMEGMYGRLKELLTCMSDKRSKN